MIFLSVLKGLLTSQYALLSLHGQLSSFLPFSLSSLAFMYVKLHVCRWNCKMHELYFFWYKGISPARIQEG